MTPKQISLRDIRIDGGTQSRVELNNTTVEEYSEAMADGVQFPPVVVFFDGASHWLVDGFHRYFGADQAGLEEIAADVRNGTQLDAQLFSFGVNSDHGLRRTNADKRKAVTGALNHPVSCKWSNNQIAKHCGVSDKTVAAVRDSHFGNSEVTTAERTYTTKHGTTAVMNTANVGKKKGAKKDKPAQQQKTTAETEPATTQDKTDSTDVPEYDGPSDEEIRAAQMQQQAAAIAKPIHKKEAPEPQQQEEDEYTDLDALADQVRDLQAEVARLKLLVPAEADEGNDMLKEMQHEMATLRQANKAITIARDRFQAENAELKRQCVWLKKQLDKQK